jgi:hypothetical protein
VCQRPTIGNFTGYGFNHFIWGGRKKEFAGHVYRECEGMMLAFDKSYYFLGYNYSVPADKRLYPREYARLRGAAKRNPNGMGLIAVEYDEVRRNPGIFSGVTMTLAAAHQPIIARIAFLHLGVRSRMGIEVTDSLVEPTELYKNDMAGDFRETFSRLRETGAQRFSPYLEARTQEAGWTRRGASALAKDICKTIENVPAWNLTNAVGHGALETFGHLRD